MTNLPDVAIGSVAAAVIAGLVFFLGSILSKNQKTSELRQAWIDGLREDVSKFIASANVMAGFRAISSSNATHYEIFKDTHESYSALNEAEASIMMRLNTKEKPSEKILSILKEHKAFLSYEVIDIDYEAITFTQKKLVSQMNVVFKREWKRVKRGEPFYVFTKYIVMLVAFLATLYVVTYLMNPNIFHCLLPSAH